MRAWLARFLLRTLIGRWLRVEVRGTLPESPFVLASNHLNWVDPFLYLGWLPPGRLFVLGRRSAVYDRGWKRVLVDLSGMVVTVEPGHHELEALTATVARRLAGARGLLLFPEGSVERGVEGELRPLRQGAAHFAAAAGVPLVPAALSGTSELWWGKRVRITIGEPFRASGDEEADLRRLAGAMSGLFTALEEPPGPHRARWLTGLLR